MNTKTSDLAKAGWTILEPGTYPDGPRRYRLDRLMAEQSPPVEIEGHFDTLAAAARAAESFHAGNADDVRIWDLRADRIIAKKIFV